MATLTIPDSHSLIVLAKFQKSVHHHYQGPTLLNGRLGLAVKYNARFPLLHQITNQNQTF